MLRPISLLLSYLLLSISPVPLNARDSNPRLNTTPATIAGPVKAATSRPINNKDLLNLRDIMVAQIAPDGTAVAFVIAQPNYETNSYGTVLCVVDTNPGSVPVNLGSTGPPDWDSTSEPPAWSPDSRYIFYRVKNGSNWGVWRWNREGGDPVQVTHSDDSVVSFELSPDGSTIVYKTQSPRNAQDEISIAEHGILYDGSYRFWRGKSFVAAELEKLPIETQVWVHDVKAGTDRRATTEEINAPKDWQSRLNGKVYDDIRATDGKIFDPKLSPDGKKVAYRLKLHDSSSHSSAYPLYVQFLDGSSAIVLTPRAFWISEFWWSRDSSEIYFKEFEVDGSPTRLQAVSAAGGTPRVIFQGADLLTHLSTDKSVTKVACVRENSTTPPELAFVDLNTGEIRTLVNVNLEFQNIELSPVTRVEWRNKYGETGFGQLVKPLHYEPGKRYPLIVTTYGSGGEFLRGAVGDEYPIQVLAANGFAVLDFDNNRQYENRPGDFDDAIHRLRSPLASLQAAVQTLNKMGLIDPKRTALTGLSHGAEITLFAISHSHLFNTAITSGGDSSDPFFYYLSRGTLWHEFYMRWGLAGWPETHKLSSRWRKLSSSLNAEQIKTSLLINVSDSEYLDVVKLKVSLEELGKPVEMFIYPTERHVKRQPKHRYEIYERNLDWLAFWLRGYEDPAPDKQVQYARWRVLRRNPIGKR